MKGVYQEVLGSDNRLWSCVICQTESERLQLWKLLRGEYKETRAFYVYTCYPYHINAPLPNSTFSREASAEEIQELKLEYIFSQIES